MEDPFHRVNATDVDFLAAGGLREPFRSGGVVRLSPFGVLETPDNPSGRDGRRGRLMVDDHHPVQAGIRRRE